MSRPVQTEGPQKPQYTRDALQARVQGSMIIRCTMTVEGRAENCTIIKPLPHMEQAVLSWIKGNRYTPVTFQGRPVAVNYVFNIKLVMPN
jgi:periplasmic protein TonB